MQADPPVRPHIPVLLDEIVEAVCPASGELIVDGTFGAGGYSQALLDAADCRVLAIDRDETVFAASAAVTARYSGRLKVVQDRYSNLAEVIRAQGVSQVDAVVLDIGVSSMQIDDPARGFSFQSDGPLDMRMGRTGPSAADIVNTASADTIADILFHLGDERQSRRIARAIAHDRDEKPFVTTLQLAGLVSRILKTPKIDGRHAATRTFQALRIYVNDELGELARALSAAESILKPGGRLVVVTFHSLEDAIVKKFFRARTGRESKGSRHGPIAGLSGPPPSFRFLNHRPINPTEAEVARNPRSRSARLRYAIRTDAAAWPLDLAALDVPIVA
jgi:16S rRNA (cytosine1402-N4)-methyltransferase